MGIAADWLALHPNSNVYQEIFFTRQIKFQYPLTSLLFVDWTLYDVRVLNLIGLAFLCFAFC